MIKNALHVLLLIVSISTTNILSAKVIMVFGDSLSAGYGMDINDGWVKLLEDRVKDEHKIVNASISGNTSGNGLSRISADLELHTPDILILELGGNDGLRGHPPRHFKSNMEKIINLSLQKDVQVLLLGIKLPPSHGRRYSKAFEEVYDSLSKTYDLPLVPFFMEKVGVNKDLMQADGIHPNEKGQPQLLENVWPELKKLLND